MMLVAVSLMINGQTANYYCGSKARADDGTVYRIKHLGSSRSVRVYNAKNSLESITSTLPNIESMAARVEPQLNSFLITILNQKFSKARLSEFAKTRVRVYLVANRQKEIKEVYFYLWANTPITVNELRELEKMFKLQPMQINKYELKPKKGTTTPLYWQNVGPTENSVDNMPEFNGIPYFTTIELIDFKAAYDAKMKIGLLGDTTWVKRL